MNEKVLKTKHVIAHGFGESAYQMVGIIQSSFILYFLVNFGGVSAATVGVIMLIARLWDAINDPKYSFIPKKLSVRPIVIKSM